MPTENAKHAKLTVRKLNLKKGKKHPENPREHPEKGDPKYEALKASLANDYFDPLVWNQRNGYWVSGNFRSEVMRDLGYTHADVVVVDYDEPTHKARMIAANNHAGEWDEYTLKRLLVECAEANLSGPICGMTDERLQEIIAQAGELPDGVVDTGKASGATAPKLADTVFQFGEYRFLVAREDYLKWQEIMRQTIGFDSPAIIAEIRKRLAL